MSTSELLTRAVETVVPRELAEMKLQSGKPLRLYLGIDPTGSKLHLGHAVPLRKLKEFVDAGHHVIFLIGSFTAMIGDPTGRDVQRIPLTREQVLDNFKTYKEQASKILDFSKVEIVYNHEWLEKMNFADIMKLASHFTVQQMLERDMFRQRMMREVLCKNCHESIAIFKSTDVADEQLQDSHWPFPVTCGKCGQTFPPRTYLVSDILEEKPISPNEFLYPLMQGYDSVVLDVDFEVGGNDQLFNMLCGRKLQKAFGKREKCVLTMKLIEGTDGRKMSKTFDNCVYLDEGPVQMFGKLMSIKDELIPVYMECCTDIPMDEIAEVKRAMGQGSNPRDMKARLAREIVTIYHGAKEAEAAEGAFDRVFKNKELPSDMPGYAVKKGTLVIDLLVQEKLATSKSDARRLIEQGGVKLNDQVVMLNGKAEAGVLKVGKRKFLRLSIAKS